MARDTVTEASAKLVDIPRGWSVNWFLVPRGERLLKQMTHEKATMVVFSNIMGTKVERRRIRSSFFFQRIFQGTLIQFDINVEKKRIP